MKKIFLILFLLVFIGGCDSLFDSGYDNTLYSPNEYEQSRQRRQREIDLSNRETEQYNRYLELDRQSREILLRQQEARSLEYQRQAEWGW